MAGDVELHLLRVLAVTPARRDARFNLLERPLRKCSCLPIIVATDGGLLTLIDTQHLSSDSASGLGIGYVDAHLLAATMLTTHARLWTRDRLLATLADQHGLARDGAPWS